MIRVVDIDKIETVSSACNKYHLARFIAVNLSTKFRYRLVKTDEIKFQLMRDESNVLESSFNFTFYGDRETVIRALIDNGYEVYVDKDL